MVFQVQIQYFREFLFNKLKRNHFILFEPFLLANVRNYFADFPFQTSTRDESLLSLGAWCGSEYGGGSRSNYVQLFPSWDRDRFEKNGQAKGIHSTWLTSCFSTWHLFHRCNKKNLNLLFKLKFKNKFKNLKKKNKLFLNRILIINTSI